jgi:alpha-tubulin suppressor-like RCC1 family protein
MIFRNNTRRFSLLALLLTLAMASNLPLSSARPAAAPPPTSGCVVGWGASGLGAETPPAGLSNVAAISAGGAHSLALKSDGTVVGWGDAFGSGAETPPASLSNVAAIAAGTFHSLALKSDGTVVGWGSSGTGAETPPAGLSNVAAIDAGFGHSLALKSDGTVVGWGNSGSGAETPPASLSDVVAIAAGTFHSLALKSDGTVVGWGNTFGYGAETPPAGLSNVVAISASAEGFDSLALKSDGTVVGWGISTPPAGLSNVVAISAGGAHSLALKSDGTVVGWGGSGTGAETPPAGLSGVTAISAGYTHSLALNQCAPSNTPPTISAVANSRQQGAPASASTIATVNDADQSAGSLGVTVNGGASATVNGVTVSGITNTDGTISATIGASCTASNASFTLEVTDSASATAMATLNVNVTANTAPTIGSYPSAGPIVVGAGTTVAPSAAPADNVSVASVTASASAGFTGSLSVNPATGVVTISNAGPAGTWVVTVTATDNCGAATIRQFTLNVQTAQQSLQSLIAQVNALVPSVLTSQKANTLTNKLDSAIKQLDTGNTAAACTHLQDFIDLVTAYIGNGTLTSAQGQPLIDAANGIKTQIGCP